MKEIEILSKPFLSKIKRKTKQVVLYNNFNIDHLPKDVRRSISPIKSRNKFKAFKNLFKQEKKVQEEENSKITREKRICFKVKKSKNVMANEEMYIMLKKSINKLKEDNWTNIFDNAFMAKINKKKIVLKIKWTKYNNFSELN